MKSFLKKIFAFLFPLFLLGSLFFIDPVFAQTVSTDDTFGGVGGETFAETAGLGSESITVIIARIIRAVIGFLGVVAVGFVIAGGVRWVTAAGDPAKVKKAQDLLKNALIGLVIVFASFSIAQFILNSLTEAVGGTTEEEEEESSTYGSDTGDASDSFFFRSLNTHFS